MRRHHGGVYNLVGFPPQRCNASSDLGMLLTPPPVDHSSSYMVRRHALVAGTLVPSDVVSRLGLTPVLSRAALSSLDTTGLKAPPTLYLGRRKSSLTVSHISLLLAPILRRQEGKTEIERLKHQQNPSLIAQNDHGSDPTDPCKDFALSTWVLGRLLPTRTRDKESFKPPCHDLPNQRAHV